jgi:hypothetical protein
VPITLTPGDGQDLFARFKQAREQRDPEAMLELYADEATYEPDPFAPSLQGANAIREHWNDIVAQQVHVDIDAERIWVVGRTVLASWHAAFTRMATAVRVRVRGFSTMELDDEGSILRMRDWSLTRDVGIDRGHRPSAPSNQAEE